MNNAKIFPLFLHPYCFILKTVETIHNFRLPIPRNSITSTSERLFRRALCRLKRIFEISPKFWLLQNIVTLKLWDSGIIWSIAAVLIVDRNYSSVLLTLLFWLNGAQFWLFLVTNNTPSVLQFGLSAVKIQLVCTVLVVAVLRLHLHDIAKLSWSAFHRVMFFYLGLSKEYARRTKYIYISSLRFYFIRSLNKTYSTHFIKK